MKRLLVAYASRHGSTTEVAVSIAQLLRATGYRVELLPASLVETLDDIDGVVLGGSIYAGRWHADARRFLERHGCQLEDIPLAIFALGPRTLAPADVAATRAQLDAALTRLASAAPDLVAIFGGVVDPKKLRFPFNRMSATDARDWRAVKVWVNEIAATFADEEAEEPTVWGLQPR